jgi:hypothetical protein
MDGTQTDPIDDAVTAITGAGLDPQTRERVTRLARFILAEADTDLQMRVGPYQLDTSRAAIKAAVTAAALAVAIEAAGLDGVPVVILAAVMPFLIEIDRVEISPADEFVVAALRLSAHQGGDDRDWYLSLPAELRAQLTQLEFLDLLGRLRGAGVIKTEPSGANRLLGRHAKLRVQLPWHSRPGS